MSDTIFGKITRGEIPSEFLYEDEHGVVIQDIHPQAPTHVLIIPRKPIPRLVDAQQSDSELLGHLLLVAGKVANDLGVGEGFRLGINNGADGGQTVFTCIFTYWQVAAWLRVSWRVALPESAVLGYPGS